MPLGYLYYTQPPLQKIGVHVSAEAEIRDGEEKETTTAPQLT